MVETRRRRRAVTEDRIRAFILTGPVEYAVASIPKAAVCRAWREAVAERLGGEETYRAFLTKSEACCELSTERMVALAKRLFAAMEAREATILGRRMVWLSRPDEDENLVEVCGIPTYLCLDEREYPAETWTRSKVAHLICIRGDAVEPCATWLASKGEESNSTSAHFPSATAIGWDAFIDNDKLVTASIPDATSVGKRAFAGCTSLREMRLPLALDVGCDAFAACHSLAAIYLPAALTFGHGVFRACSTLITIDLPSALTFGYGSFRDCVALKRVSMHRVKTVGESAFSGCVNLVHLDFPSLVVVSKDAFDECKSLVDVCLPSATYVSAHAFHNCAGLVSLTLPQTSLIDRDAFAGCASLVSLTLPKEFERSTRPRLRRKTVIHTIHHDGPTALPQYPIIRHYQR